MTGSLVVIGDALLDRDVEGTAGRLCPDAPVPVLDEHTTRTRAGGAALAACLACADGRDVTLVTALGEDEAGREVRRLLEKRGVNVVDLGLKGPTPEKVRLRADGQSLLRLDRGSTRSAVGAPDRPVASAVERADAVLVSDYGRGVACQRTLRSMVMAAGRPVVWDPHPRGPDPVPGTLLVTPNRGELLARFDGQGETLTAVTAAARRARQAWAAHGVAVTLGAHGALLVTADTAPLMAPAPCVDARDTCGAGDRFAAAVAGFLGDGALPSEAVVDAVGVASAFVARGAASAVAVDGAATGHRQAATGAERGSIEEAEAVVARARAEGHTVVATGGCFDVLHAGHVSLLQAAAALGDCLVVCINSDHSVRRLKGRGRPVVPQADRIAVLAALDCVDAVAVFDEDTPAPVLQRLRPDVFAKGGDYAGASLPESSALARWGGQAVVVPYLDGRSTTALLDHAAARGR